MNKLNQEIQQIMNKKFAQSKNCFICGTKHRLTKHHVIPVEFGGLDLDENITRLCIDCHREYHKPFTLEVKKQRYLNPTDNFLIERLYRLKLKKYFEKLK